ncbi:MAG: hypothetical protein ACD_79C00288G0007 [uncultured bacterium]|nr:MAG: hypothetical protein ACD_79C00288G0007 [uncultured bacterium]
MEIDYSIYAMKFLNFLMLLGLMLKFGYKPACSLLEETAEDIREEYELSKVQREKEEKDFETKKKLLDQADKYVSEIVEKHNAELRDFKRKVEEDTVKEINLIIEQSEDEINNFLNDTRLSLEHEFAEKALQISKEKILKNITEDDKKRYNDLFIANITVGT